MEKALNYAREQGEYFLEQLIEFLKIPTISTQEEHREEVKKGAQFIKDHFQELGVETRIIETQGNPMVYGELIQDQSRPTFLIYGHYDVQPASPLDEWESPPFDPEVRDGKLYARGATDDKGQAWIHVAALESYLKSEEEIPVNLKFLFEGEEEIGSPSLIPFFTENKELLSADALIISDTPMLQKGLPTITTGLRGLVYYEIEVKSFDQDLHSGSYGGSVENPCHALSRMIASLHDDQGKVAIPGFYDKVEEPSAEERAMIAALPFEEDRFRKSLGARKLRGEKGYSTLERKWIRPTLDVNGIWGGYTDPGAKTIVPARASAKISMRLVPNQNPQEIARLFEEYLRKIAPPTVSLEFKAIESGILPYHANTDHEYFQKAKKALSQAFETEEVVFIRQGGSIPFVPILVKTLKVPCLLLGFGLPGENAHSPNEWFDLGNFHRGIETMIRFYGTF